MVDTHPGGCVGAFPMIHADEYAGFLAKIRALPDDDAPRLQLADRYDDDEQHERAEFVRVQIALAEIERLPHFVSDTQGLHQRERELLQKYCYLWLPVDGDWWCENIENPPTPVERIGATFRRGFVHSITCTAADWFAHADAILSQHPVRAVTLTTWPEHHYLAKCGSVSLFPDGDSRAKPLYDHLLQSLEEAIKKRLSEVWSGVAFTLPQPGGLWTLNEQGERVTVPGIRGELIDMRGFESAMWIDERPVEMTEAEMERISTILVGNPNAARPLGVIDADDGPASPPAERQTGPRRARSIEFMGRHRRPRR